MSGSPLLFGMNMKYENETIAAICTGLTGSGINIIRISGKEAFSIAEKIFKSYSGKSVEKLKGFSACYGYIIEEKDNKIQFDNVDNVDKSFENYEIIDEVLILKMNAPHSYTREDVIEIDCHGGITVTKKILQIVLKNGARLAEPGEFTKRAFLNGRIDLSGAEAVIDIINAKSNLALKYSVRQLRGEIKDKISALREEILSKTAYIEAALDDPEHISLDGFTDSLELDIGYIYKEVKKLVDSYNEGKYINEGINTCILGLPNAGKSSLLNALLNEERAIVTDIAGTTRDVLKETYVLDDIVLNIKDTAGIRSTSDKIEKIGVEKAKKEAMEADLILYVVDSSLNVSKEDVEIISSLSDKKVIFLYNKSDIQTENREDDLMNREHIYDEVSLPENVCCKIKISALKREGIEELKNKIKELFYNGSILTEEDIIITNERHRELLIKAGLSLENVMSGIQNKISEDFLTIDLMDAYEYLGMIIGESVEDDLADKIFSDFCMGK